MGEHAGRRSPAYHRFLANQLRKRYGFRGTPIRIVIKQKSGDRHKPEKGKRPTKRPAAKREPRRR